MEQGETSQPSVRTLAKSGAILNAPRGTIHQGLPRPKTKELSYVEEISRRDYNPRRNHRHQYRRYRSPSPFHDQHVRERDRRREYYSPISDSLSQSPSRDIRRAKTNKDKAPAWSSEGNNRQGAT
ncbi:hypothetical protein LIER_43295 [Lithospermum erythrorhizon]|uniref:Uncharacterized protein n=1 Tax=Lithospermum erythrorhizon TaxID=34254 RepID=A0AAV3PX76_LITER